MTKLWQEIEIMTHPKDTFWHAIEVLWVYFADNGYEEQVDMVMGSLKRVKPEKTEIL